MKLLFEGKNRGRCLVIAFGFMVVASAFAPAPLKAQKQEAARLHDKAYNYSYGPSYQNLSASGGGAAENPDNHFPEAYSEILAKDPIKTFNQTPKTKTLNHTFRVPVFSENFGIKQEIIADDEQGSHLTAASKNISISASYLYQVTKRFRIGPELIHTTFNKVGINDSFSLMARGELSLFTTKNLDLYATAGFGLSFDTFNIIDLLVQVKEVSVGGDDSFRDYLVTPLINGSSIPDRVAIFYCSNAENYANGLNEEHLNKNGDEIITVFNGRGFGICLHDAHSSGDEKQYKEIKSDLQTPLNMISIPWFVGIGLDYDLVAVLHKVYGDPLGWSEDNSSHRQIGLSVGARYFNNGFGRVVRSSTYLQPAYLYIRYPGFYSVALGLYFKV